MKYILKKDLPLAKAGTEVFIYSPITSWLIDIRINDGDWYMNISCVKKENIPEWLEEIAKPKTMKDLKEWDTFWTIENCWDIQKWFMHFDYTEWFLDITRCFVTEREAKRHKLLRELATRTDKWLPEDNERYITANREKPTEWVWSYDNLDILYYHQWIVFRNEEEYNKWITPENADLLFNI